jgi:hypothetical protein
LRRLAGFAVSAFATGKLFPVVGKESSCDLSANEIGKRVLQEQQLGGVGEKQNAPDRNVVSSENTITQQVLPKFRKLAHIRFCEWAERNASQSSSALRQQTLVLIYFYFAPNHDRDI